MFLTTKSTNLRYFVFQSIKYKAARLITSGIEADHSSNSCDDGITPCLCIVAFGGNVNGMHMRLMSAQKYWH